MHHMHHETMDERDTTYRLRANSLRTLLVWYSLSTLQRALLIHVTALRKNKNKHDLLSYDSQVNQDRGQDAN